MWLPRSAMLAAWRPIGYAPDSHTISSHVSLWDVLSAHCQRLVNLVYKE
jgi:hypothetical protein